MNFLFLSANNAVTIESNTFSTHAPYIKKRKMKMKEMVWIIKFKSNSNQTKAIEHLNRIVRTDVVLINRLQPTNIVVSVSNQMHVNFPGNQPRRSIVHHKLRLRMKNSRQKQHDEQRNLHWRCKSRSFNRFDRQPSLVSLFRDQSQKLRMCMQ